jgi:plasmid stabilization system protein ParE
VARVIRSPRAKRDIVEVIAHTKERWGKAQARAYGQLIEDALAVIATDAQCGKSRNAARPDILALHIRQRGDPLDTFCSIGLAPRAPWRYSASCTT